MLLVLDSPAVCWSVLVIDDLLEPALLAPVVRGEPFFDLTYPYESHFMPGVHRGDTKRDPCPEQTWKYRPYFGCPSRALNEGIESLSH